MAHDASAPPRLDELMARYLARQARAHAAGLASTPGEVTPYEAGPVQPIDPQLAWDEALAVLSFYGPAMKRAWPPLPHWPALVASHEPVLALPWALGHFPQLVRSFQQLLHPGAATAPQTSPGVPVAVPQLVEWADAVAGRREYPQVLLALAGLRLAKQFEAAKQYAARHDPHVPPAWRAGWENERAALAWQAGETASARQLWHALAPSPPVLFNRGVAELFLGQPAPARSALEAALPGLPAAGGWPHLARLYLALATTRGS